MNDVFYYFGVMYHNDDSYSLYRFPYKDFKCCTDCIDFLNKIKQKDYDIAYALLDRHNTLFYFYTFSIGFPTQQKLTFQLDDYYRCQDATPF